MDEIDFDVTERHVLPFRIMTLSYGRHVSEALVAWCDETLATLGQLENQP